MMPADIREIDIPGGPTGHVHVHIVRPQGSSEALPVAMFYHGGGWVLGGFDTHERLVRELANKANAALIFVDYTPSPEAKYPVIPGEDYRALEYIAGNGPRHNLDSSRLAVVGDSVGGNMAAVMALMAKERDGPDIALQALFYQVQNRNPVCPPKGRPSIFSMSHSTYVEMNVSNANPKMNWSAASLASPFLWASGTISSTTSVVSTPAVNARMRYFRMTGCPLTSQ